MVFPNLFDYHGPRHRTDDMSSFSKTAMHASAAESVMHKPLYGYFEPSDSREQSTLRNHLVAASGEFVGTYMFLLLAFLGHSTVASSTNPRSETLLYIALSYSVSYLVNIWLMHGISGGFFNPVATLALVLCGELPPMLGIIFFPVHLLGAVLAAETVQVLTPGNMRELQVVLAPNVHVVQGMFLEVILTAILVFAILVVADTDSNTNTTSPIPIGIAYFVAQMAGTSYTGASLSPARSLAPCIATSDFPPYHWIYWVGPLLGAFLASLYYHFVRYFNNSTVDNEPPTLFPSETSPLLQTRHITESPGPASPRSRRQTLADVNQPDTDDSRERGEATRKQHHRHHPYYRYRRDGRFDVTPKQDIGRRFSDGRTLEQIQRQDEARRPSGDEAEQVRLPRGKDKVIIVNP